MTRVMLTMMVVMLMWKIISGLRYFMLLIFVVVVVSVALVVVVVWAPVIVVVAYSYVPFVTLYKRLKLGV